MSTTVAMSARSFWNPAETRHRVLDKERAHAGERAVGCEDRGAAPGRMRRGGEDRVVEQIFPAPGELAPRDDFAGDGEAATTARGDNGVAAFGQPSPIGDAQRLRRNRIMGADEPESRFIVIGDDMSRDRLAARGMKRDRVRLGNQISYDEDETAHRR